MDLYVNQALWQHCKTPLKHFPLVNQYPTSKVMYQFLLLDVLLQVLSLLVAVIITLLNVISSIMYDHASSSVVSNDDAS